MHNYFENLQLNAKENVKEGGVSENENVLGPIRKERIV